MSIPARTVDALQSNPFTWMSCTPRTSTRPFIRAFCGWSVAGAPSTRTVRSGPRLRPCLGPACPRWQAQDGAGPATNRPHHHATRTARQWHRSRERRPQATRRTRCCQGVEVGCRSHRSCECPRSTGDRIVRLDQGRQVHPRHDLDHLAEKLLAPRRLLLGLAAQRGERALFHRGQLQDGDGAMMPQAGNRSGLP